MRSLSEIDQDIADNRATMSKIRKSMATSVSQGGQSTSLATLESLRKDLEALLAERAGVEAAQSSGTQQPLGGFFTVALKTPGGEP